MKIINESEVKAISGGALWLIPVGVYIWYEYGGGKEAIESLK